MKSPEIAALPVLALAALSLTAPLGAQTWRQRIVEAPGYPVSAAWDEARGRLVMYAGATWEWDGFSWARRAPVPPNSGGPLAYDPVTQRVLMFGGFDVSQWQELNETWAWDGFSWEKLAPAQRPPARAGHRMVLDRARGRIVMFGGFAGQGYYTVFRDTWEWDGVTWTRVASSGPRGRVGHSMVYDPVRQRTMLFGGDGAPPYSYPLSDTWEWDGSSWTRRNVSGPSARSYHDAAWDEARQRAVLQGGSYWNGLGTVYLGDTWEWDGASWTRILRGGTPGGQTNHVLTYEPARGQVMLTAPTGLWFWNGVEWVGSKTYPTARQTRAAAFDQARGEVVLYSGNTLAETWVWNGARWRVAQNTSPPGVRSNHALAYDAARGETVLFGGSDADTWAWDGSTWHRRATVGPSMRNGAAMVYDSSRQRVVLFGGEDGSGFTNETWEWDGAAWSRATPAARPPVRRGATMAFDPARGRMVLFGGYVQSGGSVWLADTWEWDGATWTQQSPVTSPSAREGHGMVYDPVHGGVVLSSGQGSIFQFDAWLWDGADWTRLALGTGPQGFVALVRDTARDRLVAFARPSPSYIVETWELGASVAAAAGALGSGCPGSGGRLPALDSLGLPRRDRPGFALDVGLIRANAPGALLLSAESSNQPLGGGCVLRVHLPTTLAVPFTSTAAGFFSQPLPLARTLPLGVGLFGQAVVIDPAGAFAGLAFTNGLQLTIGE